METKKEKQERLIKIINSVFDLDIKRNKKSEMYVLARASYCKILRDLNYQYMDIGNRINKHHASIIHSYRNFSHYKQFFPSFINLHNKVLSEFGSREAKEYMESLEKLKEENEALKSRIKELHSHNARLSYQLENKHSKNNILHNMIDERVRPNTLKEVEIKLNRLLNGVGS